MDRVGAKIGNSLRKRARRRSHTRKVPINGFMNMAEVRREIVNALQLHRSTSTSSTLACGPEIWNRDTSNSVLGKEIIAESFNYNINRKAIVMSSQHYYPSIDSIPVPEPIWSTTAPAVLAVPPAAEIVEFEWPENFSSSYTWWSSFLNSMDGKSSAEISNYSYIDNTMVENSKVYGQFQDGANLEAPILDANDQNPFPDEWLIVPTAEDSSDLL